VSAVPPSLACVVLAHTDPVHVRRLIAALDPFPVFLHCDVRTSDDVFARMTEGLPDRVTVMPRRRTAWARWEMVAAELDGYRAALRTGASHVALLTGSDYPLASTAQIAEFLATIPGRSVTLSQPLPIPQWGHGGGFWRLRFRFRAWNQRMLLLPVPRRLPRGVVPAGGSQLKLLAREHAATVVSVADGRPDLVRYWRSTWIPDETFVYSVLHTPALAPGFLDQRVEGTAWYIKWDEAPRKSPPWLTSADLPELARARDGLHGVPALFARKFSSTVDPGVVDAVDRTLRTPA
jgi:Core-2/I-Branching enzyme